MRKTFLLLLLMLPGCDDGETAAITHDATHDVGVIPDGQAASPDGQLTDAAAHDAALPDGTAPDSGTEDPDGGTEDPDSAVAAPDAAADLGVPQPECEEHADCLGFSRCEDAECVPPGPSPLSAVLVLNEILIDGAIDDDANGDGDISALDDEFVELLNVGPMPVDLSGATLVESDILGVPRHTFPEGTTLDAGHALVVFGGGEPSEALQAVENATFVVINAQDPAFSNGLNLDDAGDTLRLLDASGDEIFVFAYGSDCAADCPPVMGDQSLTRSPDGEGAFVPHTQAAAAAISPGTQTDGSPF